MSLTCIRWPKMDLTNARSMELFRKLGIAEGLRSNGNKNTFSGSVLKYLTHLGVASHIPCPVLISTGLSQGKAITQWYHPSVDEYRARIAERNDGTQPLEPYQRISQAVFEKWFSSKCAENPLIDLRFNCKLESIKERESSIKANIIDLKSGIRRTFSSKYVIGCDGASSRVRRSMAIPLDGGPMYVHSHLPSFHLLQAFK
jgi:FAD-dependent monooxygenase